MRKIKHFIDLKNTEDQIRCNQDDYDDMHDLLIKALFLIIVSNSKKNATNFAAYVWHAMAVLDGIWAIQNLQHSKQSSAIFFIIFGTFFALGGFKQNKEADKHATERDNHQKRYDELKELLKNSNPNLIHQITQQYRKELPVEKQDIGFEDIQATIDHIIMKFYQR